MTHSCLGESFDIHGGGPDLKFPHHENEIAQSEAAHDASYANTWMHAGAVRVDGEKMSKSLGNFFTIREILEKYSAEVVRFFLLSSQYRSAINYSEETFACKEYIVDLQTGDTLEKDYQEFLIAIFDNEKVRTKIKEKIEKFVEIAKNNGDLETWWWMEDEIKFLTENIDDYFNMMVESFAEEEELFELPTDQMEVDYRIYIDDSGLFRNMVFSQILPLTEEESPIPASINSTIKMDMFNYGKQLNFTEFDPVGAFDAGKASMEEWTALGEEVMMKAIEELMFNPLFQDIMLLSSMIEESEE